MPRLLGLEIRAAGRSLRAAAAGDGWRRRTVVIAFAALAVLAGALPALGAGGRPAAVSAAAVSAAVDGAVGDREWRAVDGLGPVELILDVAFDGAGRFAMADTRGVLLGQVSAGPVPAARARRLTSQGATTRVRFDGSGGLFAVGERGLVHVGVDGQVRDRTPRVGQGGRGLVALDVARGWLVVGGDGGLWVARLSGGADAAAPISAWRRVQEGVSPGLVSDVALGLPDRSGATPLWLVAEGKLHLLWLTAGPDGVSASPARVQRPAGRPIGEAVRRVRVDAATGDVFALYARAVAHHVVTDRAAHRQGTAGRWDVVFPTLPPAAEFVDVAFEAGRVWWATTAGVLRAEGIHGSVARASSPVGSRAATAVSVQGAVIWVAASDRLWLGAWRPRPIARFGAIDRMPRDPELASVHARALQYLGLRTAEIDGMWRGLGRRAWLPSVSLHGGADYGSDSGRDYDENFSYGQLNALNDRSSDRSTDFDAGIALSWDLADLAWAPESVELSREARQVIGLRDNVLDELNQLYFDRQRALRALAAFADWSDPEAATLRLRALELAAGLDGWTGGWFSAHVELPDGARASWSPRPAGGLAVPLLARPKAADPVPGLRSGQALEQPLDHTRDRSLDQRVPHTPDQPVPIRTGRNDS